MTFLNILVNFLLIGAGVTFIAGGIKAKNGTLKRNFWVGMRSQTLKSSEEAWAVGNAAAAIPMIVCGGLYGLFAGWSA